MDAVYTNKRDIVISSSIEILRNIKNLDFTDNLDADIAKGNINNIYELISNKFKEENFQLVKLWEDKLNNELIEKKIINKEIIKRKEKAAFLYNKDSTLSIMLNGEDHITIKCTLDGLNLKEEYDYANRIDDSIENSIEYAFHEEFGYLTASPYNIGTGLKASVTLHLPGIKINGKIDEISEKLNKSGFLLKGLYGEKDREYSNTYIVCNKITIGLSEEKIINNLLDAVSNIIFKEYENRDILMNKYKIDMEDKVFRAYAILKNARMINEQELLELLSNIRFGVEMSILEIDKKALDKILIDTRNSVIEGKSEQSLSEKKKNIERARITRDILNSI